MLAHGKSRRANWGNYSGGIGNLHAESLKIGEPRLSLKGMLHIAVSVRDVLTYLPRVPDTEAEIQE